MGVSERGIRIMSTQVLYIFGVVPFLVASLLTSVLTVLVRQRSISLSFLEETEPGRYHGTSRPLGGGIAIALSVFAVVGLGLCVSLHLLSAGEGPFRESIRPNVEGIRSRLDVVGYLFFGGGLVFVTGLLDDVRGLAPWSKLLGIVVGAAVVVAGGIRFSLFTEAGTFVHEATRILLTALWIVVVTNAFNLLDNMDGQCAGVSFLIGLALGVISLQAGAFIVGLCAFVVSGSAFGFLVYNAPPARIFAGDAGSLTLGFFLSTTAVLTTSIQHDLSVRSFFALIVLFSVPLYDTASVLWIRFREGRPLMKADTSHFSHRMVEQGYSERAALLLTMFLTLLTGLLSMVLFRSGTFEFFVGGVLVLAGFVGLIETRSK